MKVVLIALAVLAPSFASAGDVKVQIAKVEKQWNDCHANPDNQSTAGMNGCNAEAYDGADAILNAQYQGLQKILKGEIETLARLKKAQRAWIAFRDAECQLQGTSMLGGSGEGTIISGCLASKTVDRVKEIEELFGETL